MRRFEEYRRGQGNVYYRHIPYYLKWVRMYQKFTAEEPSEKDTAETVRSFTQKLGLSYEAWQVSQAQDAVRRYVYYLSREEDKDRHAAHIPVPVSGFGSLEEQSRKLIRLKQLSYQTEKTYLQWLKRFYEYLKGRTPTAVDRRVSAATGKQAFNALLFLFRHVLFIEVRGLDDVVASPKRGRLPVCLRRPRFPTFLNT